MHYVDVLNNQTNRCLILGKDNVFVSTPKPPDHPSVSPIFPLNQYVRLSQRKNSVRCGQMTSYSCLVWSNDQLLLSGMVKWPAALVWYGQMTSCSCLVWSNDQLLLSGMVKWPAALFWYGQMTSYSSIRLHCVPRDSFFTYCRRRSSGRDVSGQGLRPIDCWDCGFESRWGAGIFVLCCVLYSKDKTHS